MGEKLGLVEIKAPDCRKGSDWLSKCLSGRDE